MHFGLSFSWDSFTYLTTLEQILALSIRSDAFRQIDYEHDFSWNLQVVDAIGELHEALLIFSLHLRSMHDAVLCSVLVRPK